MKNQFLFTLLLMLLATLASAQSNVLCIEVPIRPEFKKIERGISIELEISGKCGKDSIEYERWINGDGRMSIVNLGDLPDGVYRVQISERYTKRSGIYIEDFSLGYFTFPVVVLENNRTVHLKQQMPGDCKYFRDFVDNNCPVCHSNKNVIRICRGLRIIDPLDREPEPECHFSEIYSGCDTRVCSPMWYCNEDKIEF